MILLFKIKIIVHKKNSYYSSTLQMPLIILSIVMTKVFKKKKINDF